MSTKNYDHLTRQLEIIPLEKLKQKIIIIGAGAIGSFTALALAKMGFINMTVYDFDDVNIENMNNQFYRMKDVGTPKVLALQALIEDFTNEKITIINERFEAQELNGIVITAVDSMKARAMIWDRIKKAHDVKFLIDPRMASEYALQYVINPGDMKDRDTYEKVLYSDENSIQERCTAKATMYTVNMISGYVAKAVKDIVTDGDYARVTDWNIGTNSLQNWPKQRTI